MLASFLQLHFFQYLKKIFLLWLFYNRNETKNCFFTAIISCSITSAKEIQFEADNLVSVLPSYPSYAEYIKFYIFLSWNASNLTVSSPNKYLLLLSCNKDILKEIKLPLKTEKTKNLLLTVNLAFYLPIWLSYYLGLLAINLEVIISVKVYPKCLNLAIDY